MLGNHDTILMVPALEAMGITMLLNESEIIERAGERIHLAGIDDAHYYRMDNLDKAAADIPPGAFSILISHTPEIYRQAAHADFDVLLSGHTHGGQICLPGRIPITLDSVLPRSMGSGRLALSRHDRLHLGRRRLLGRPRALQLPAGDHPASPSREALNRRARSIGPIAQVQVEQEAREHEFATKKSITTARMSSQPRGSRTQLDEQRKSDSGI